MSRPDALRRQLRVRYPAGRGRVVLRTELDWDRDLEPIRVSDDGETSTFALEARKPFLYFKPCLRTADGEVRWSVGPNLLVLMTTRGTRDVFPYFEGSAVGSFSASSSSIRRSSGEGTGSASTSRPGTARTPCAGTRSSTCRTARTSSSPRKPSAGGAWQVDETLHLLDGMNAVDRVVVVGIYSGDRMGEYTKPGYEAYARSVVEEIKPEVEGHFRVFGSPRETGVIGSSLGGVVSFYMAWQHPEAFGFAACMSSTFSHRDDLIDRVLSEPKSTSKFYLDSGWPGDNYEVTLAMAMALSQAATASARTSCISSSRSRSTTSRRGAGGSRPGELGLSPVAAANRGRFI